MVINKKMQNSNASGYLTKGRLVDAGKDNPKIVINDVCIEVHVASLS